jgi:two-component system, sensor histidine kinase and response regulator
VADQPAIDRAVIERLDRLGGKKLATGMIDIFLEHAPTRIDAAQAALAVDDVEEIRRAAHSLKSSAGNLGATRLQALCETIERIAQKQETNGEIAGLVARMATECDTASRELTEIRKLYV